MSRILVVDDEEGIRASIRRVLTLEGYEVTLAENGDEGELRFRENHPDLVITDIVMPGRNGLEMLASLKADFPDMKAIVMSGGGGHTAGAEDLSFLLSVAEGMGIHRTITKPFELEDILSAVCAALGGS
jgi:DNA-binding NtrC family response regulator